MNPYLLAFHQIQKCTNTRLFKIYRGNSDWQYAWEKAGENDFVSWGIERDIAVEIMEQRKQIDPSKILEQLYALNADIVSYYDEDYPFLLKQIADPPILLYYRGNKQLFFSRCLSIVGTRLMSSYGKQILDNFIPTFVYAGITIVSGLAFGVDAYAHQITIREKGGTIAVLGSGIDKIYPLNNKKLAEQIIENNGMILSEFPLGLAPTVYTFPIRNRIISGLSKGVVIIEAKKSSGSLITAQSALDQNREVFALSGNIFAPNMEGTHELIRKGEATLVFHPQQVLKDLHWDTNSFSSVDIHPIVFQNEKEEKIYQFLSKEPVFVDELIQQSHISSSEVSTILSYLEMKGLVQNIGGMKWIRR